MTRKTFKIMALMICCSGISVPSAVAAAEVWLVELQGPLGPAKADFIIRSIDRAEDEGAAALIIYMDTPGGLDAAMRDLVKRVLAADVPVITFVAPNGSRAASAGTYIAYASHIAAMAPATNIGSSTPVSLGGGSPVPDFAPGPEPEAGSGEGDETPPPGDPMSRKVVNDAVAYLQSLAELRGRNVEWAEQTVRAGANIRANEAVDMNVVDLVALDTEDLLGQLHGVEVVLPTRRVTLSLDDVVVVRQEPDWQHQILEIITDPTIAYALLIFGVWGLILEFYSPGAMFPAVFGIISLILGAYGLQMLPVNYAGLALIIVGLGFMAIEAYTPTLGILGVAGVAAFIFGSMILMDTEMPEYQIPLAIIAGFAVSAVGLLLLVVGFALRARAQGVVSGVAAMLEQPAEAVDDFVVEGGHQVGKVWVAGELWRAHSAQPTAELQIRKGDRLRVRSIDDLSLTVEKER